MQETCVQVVNVLLLYAYCFDLKLNGWNSISLNM